ncbi:MAG: FAD-dependent oxidoreductase, partial [Alphaproteobacteria bacterium]|nr:FAD-dependent oxidoreductase [Alphaproteobacteria bacterium]
AVVGGGGAGMAAALEAAQLGRRVVLLEKNPSLGGSTAWSVGSISATNTPQQRARGIVDHPDAHFEDLETLAGAKANRDNRALRRILVDNTTEMMRWLEDIGLVFTGPNIEKPHRLPRMHNVLPNSRAFPEMLGKACRRAGVDIRCSTAAVDLMREEGRIAGVLTQDGNGVHGLLNARGGVILAGGDYSASAELKARFVGEAAARLAAVNPTANGAAIELGLKAGGEVVNGDILRGPTMRFIPPTRESFVRRLPPSRTLARALKWSLANLPESIQRPFAMGFLTTALGPSPNLFRAGAILVNRDGDRFADELDNPGPLVPLQPAGLAYILLDAAIAEKFRRWPYYVSTAPGIAYAHIDDYRRNRKDIFHKGGSVEELARSLGADAERLRNSIDETKARDGEATGRVPLGIGPFIALGPVRSYVVFTDGGLRVTERLEVVGGDGGPIPGLYAAGSTGQGGLILEGHGHHLGWAFVSGRLAGRHAALAIPAAHEHD